jgi:hypothetical protein
MADIKQAARWMKRGEKVRRTNFFGNFWYAAARKLSGVSDRITTSDDNFEDEPLTIADLLAEDWDIAP